MANKVSFIFKAIDQFTRVGKKIGSVTTGMTNKFKKMRLESKRTEAQTGRMSKGIIGGFQRMAIAATGFFSVMKAINIGGEFQDAIAELSAITGAAGADLDFMSDEILRLSKNSAIAQNIVAKAFTDIASAKSELLKDPKGLSTITEQALLLANAAGISVPDAVQASVGALNQFNVGADQAARFVNVLAASSKVGAAQVQDIVLSMKNAGTVAARFNLTFEETNSMIQVLAKNGVKGAEAGTALRGTLVKLEKIAGGRFAPSRIGIIKSLEMIEKLGLTNKQIIKEFGEENLRSILILRDNIPLIKQWTSEITGTNIAQEQADKRLATFNAKMRKLGIILRDSIIKTFLRLEPTLTKNVEAFAAWIEKLDDKNIQGFVDSLKVMLDVFTKIVKLVGKLIGFLADVGDLLGQVAAAVANLDFSQFNISQGQRDIWQTTLDVSNKVPGADAVNRFLAFAGDKLFGEDEPVKSKDTMTDINVNITAPPGAVNSVTQQTTGKNPSMNIGLNMFTGGY